MQIEEFRRLKDKIDEIYEKEDAKIKWSISIDDSGNVCYGNVEVVYK